MLKSIKGTISSVKEDVTQSLQSLASATSTHVVPQRPNSALYVKGCVDLNTGAKLLHRYSEVWKTIHENSEDVSKRAEEVDRLVGNIHQSIEKQNSAMNHFLSELSALSHLLSAVTNVQEHLGKLENDFITLEKQLIELEDVCEQQDMRVQRSYHESQLLTHQKRKHQELEQTKVSLAAKHHKKVQEMEQHMVATLHERQLVFANAHQEQMQNYKKSGQIEERISRASSTDCDDIGDIVIEENIHDLERFLEDLGISDEKTDKGVEAGKLLEQKSHFTNPTITDISTGSESDLAVDFNAQATATIAAVSSTTSIATNDTIICTVANGDTSIANTDTTAANEAASTAVVVIPADIPSADKKQAEATPSAKVSVAIDRQAAANSSDLQVTYSDTDTLVVTAANMKTAVSDTQVTAAISVQTTIAANTQALTAESLAQVATDTQTAAISDKQTATTTEMQASTVVTDAHVAVTDTQASSAADVNVAKDLQSYTYSVSLTNISDQSGPYEVKERSSELLKRSERETVVESHNNQTNGDSNKICN